MSFASNDTLVVDANNNKIIREIDAARVHKNDSEDGLYEDIEDLQIEDILNEDPGALLTADRPAEDGEFTANFSDYTEEVAEEDVSTTEEDVEAYMEEARKKADTMYEDAKNRGYSDGYDEGVVAGKAEYEEKQAALEIEINKAREDLELAREQMIADLEPKFVDIACELMKKLTSISLEEDKNILVYLMNNAVKEIEGSKKFTFRVSDADYEYVEEHKSDIYGYKNPNIEFEFFADSKLVKGQCVIETDNGIIDCSLDVQLDNIIRAMKLLSRA